MVASVTNSFVTNDPRSIMPSGMVPLDGKARPPSPGSAPGGTGALGTRPTPQTLPLEPVAPDDVPVGSAESRPLQARLRAQIDEIRTRRGAALARNRVFQTIGPLFAGTGAGTGTGAVAGAENAGEEPLGALFDGFVQSWQQFAKTPSDAAKRKSVIAKGDTLARTVRTLSTAVEALGSKVNQDIAENLEDLNRTLARIHQENRAIAAESALGRPTGEIEARRNPLIDHVVELTGARVFPRENRTVALFTTGGQPLLDQRPLRFIAPPNNPPPAPRPGPPGGAATAKITPTASVVPLDGVPAQGRIVDGKLGTLLRIVADGARAVPPQPADPDPGTEVVRKLRSQLDAVAGSVLGRSRPNQPMSFADAYDTARTTGANQLAYGFFIGDNRESLAINPKLTLDSKPNSENVALKETGVVAAAAALTAPNRQVIADGLALAKTSYGGFAQTMTTIWTRVSAAADREARVAVAADGLMGLRRQDGATLDLQPEVGKLQALQTGFSVTRHIGYATGELLGALGAGAP